MRLPQLYGRYPIKRPTGSLGAQFTASFDTIERNFDLLQTTTTQTTAYLKDIDSRIPTDVTARVYAIEQGRVPVFAVAPDDPADGQAWAAVIGGSGTWDFVVKVNESGTIYSASTPLAP